MEKISQVAKKYFLENDNSCAESTLKAAAELFNLPLDENLIKAVGSFAGGCGVGDLCGTAAGSAFAIGLKYGNGCVHDCEIQKEKIKEFMTQYKEIFHSTDCSSIKEEFKQEDVRCLQVVEKTLELLSCIFDENKC